VVAGAHSGIENDRLGQVRIDEEALSERLRRLYVVACGEVFQGTQAEDSLTR
jgi:hypothetical protein